MARAGRRPAVEVEGARELRRALSRFEDAAADLRALHRDLGDIVAARATEIVPWLTGNLERTIRAARSKTGARVTAGGSSAVYGPPIHFGWRARNIEPQPFLYDALDDRKGEVIAAYHSHVDDLVRKFDREAPD